MQHVVAAIVLAWVYLRLAGVWARVHVTWPVWVCGDMAPPTRTVPYPCPQTHIIQDDDGEGKENSLPLFTRSYYTARKTNIDALLDQDDIILGRQYG